MATKELKFPAPWFGGKTKIADLVWDRFGNPDNFIEPFCGSAAVTLRRPADHFKGKYRVETLNDANHFLVNVFRALRHDPDAVAEWADNIVSEADLHAIHEWLMKSAHCQEYRDKMKSDPDYYDAKIAGRWIYGACCWIGSGWCDESRMPSKQIPELAVGRGVTAPNLSAKIPELSVGRGDTSPHGRPQLTDAFDIGRGVNSNGNISSKRPRLAETGEPGTGVCGSSGVSLQIPHLSNAGQGDIYPLPCVGTCESRREWLKEWMRSLSDRLRLVRTCYGHWSRVCDSESTLFRLGSTGVILDPPYPTESVDGKKSRAGGLYSNDDQDLNKLRDEVLDWCLRWGDHPDIKIAVCGYEADGYESLLEKGWTQTSWSAGGGYGNQSGKKSDNASRERIWWNPAASEVEEKGLFAIKD